MNDSNEIELVRESIESKFDYNTYLYIALNEKLEQLEKQLQECQQPYKNIEEKLNKNADLFVDVQKRVTYIQFQIDSLSVVKRLKKFLKPKLNLDQHPPKPLILSEKYQKNIQLKMFPKISIVTPSFNQGDYIERTMKSVLEQNYPNIEYIVQDGGSKDNTIEILSKFDSRLSYWESAKDKGQTHAINLGFARTTGDIMAYLNSDDILLPNALPYVVKYFEEHPEVDAVYGHRILIDKMDREVGRWILPAHANKVMQWVDYVPQETLFWRRRIWDKIDGKLDENFQFAMDWDLLLRFQEAGAKIVRLPRFLAAFRVHDEQKSSSVITEMGFHEMQQLRIRCHKRPVEQQEIRKNIKYYLIKHIILQKLFRLGLLKY
jgi:glycosyltransferase involved in cell wall biosynthesis